jgi:Hint domain
VAVWNFQYSWTVIPVGDFDYQLDEDQGFSTVLSEIPIDEDGIIFFTEVVQTSQMMGDVTYIGKNALGIVAQDNLGTIWFFTNDAAFLSTDLITIAEVNYVCLLEGTLIPTIEGEKPVESLKRGDQVLTSSGDYKSVRWVGVQTIKHSIFTNEALPILIPKDSLGDNVPNRDLLVSSDHAIFLDGFLIAAEALIDGNIRRVTDFQNSEIKYYGIDLGPATIHPVHNLPVGSLGAVDRQVFDNYQEWLDLDEELIDEPLMYPRVKHRFQIPAYLGSSKGQLKSAN